MHSPSSSVGVDATRGALGGVVATIVMSVLMLVGKRAGLMPEHPPKKIARAAMAAGGDSPDERQTGPLASALHLGFGVSAGVAFGLIHRLMSPIVPPSLTGVLFALAVWAVSYLGWMPALGIIPRADRDVPGRAVVLIAAHVVYGAVLGTVVGRDPARRVQAGERPTVS